MSDLAAMTGMPSEAVRQVTPILPLRIRDLVLRFGETTVLDGIDLDLGPTG